MCAQLLNHVGVFVTSWTIATKLISPAHFSDKNTGVGFQTLKPGLLHFLHWQADFILLCHLGSPRNYVHTLF